MCVTKYGRCIVTVWNTVYLDSLHHHLVVNYLVKIKGFSNIKVCKPNFHKTQLKHVYDKYKNI